MLQQTNITIRKYKELKYIIILQESAHKQKL